MLGCLFRLKDDVFGMASHQPHRCDLISYLTLAIIGKRPPCGVHPIQAQGRSTQSLPITITTAVTLWLFLSLVLFRRGDRMDRSWAFKPKLVICHAVASQLLSHASLNKLFRSIFLHTPTIPHRA